MKIRNKLSYPEYVQIAIFVLFVGEYICMMFGCNIVPTNPETNKLFYSIQTLLLTIFSAPTLSTLVQKFNNSFGDDDVPPKQDIPNDKEIVENIETK